ncbi:hypothetical protein Mal4_30190 [Maioricimonas rarisocia]|uniref:YdhG-like domain-containing protein n=1 Tax=Maioricimonas rarisocia TaxID=2528026 RepID=A0A517Z8B6_9PLAN|nr:DUF1801 domain-containing protein [Maioricimonas rarisocia]QDU38689.1 hypothetical protein Mal4_30190 [Maioricimonas rarisocia]
MAEPKTQKTTASVEAFLRSIDDEQRRKDCRAVVKLMRQVTGEKPAMWRDAIIGFGSYHYRYASGREGDWMLIGVSPRKQALSIYLMCEVEAAQKLLNRLGKYKMGKSCLYVKKLEDIDLEVLEELIRHSIAETRRMYPE